MGIYPIFNPALPSVKFDSDGKALLRQLQDLDQVALKLGMVPLSSFADCRDVPDGFDGSPDELEELLGPWNEWFAASDGLDSTEKLASVVRTDPGIAAGIKSSNHICEELDELVRCLRAAVQPGAQFRLEVG